MDIVSSSAENFWVIQGDPLRGASEILHQLIGDFRVFLYSQGFIQGDAGFCWPIHISNGFDG